MTDKMKCCFCGAELTGHEDAYGNISDIWFDCPNEECEHAWTTFRFDIWQSLIDGKKALSALERIGKILILDSDKPLVLTVKGKQEIKRIIRQSTKQGATSNDTRK